MKVWKIYNGKIEVVSFVIESDRIITTGVTLAILFSLFRLNLFGFPIFFLWVYLMKVIPD
jgi:hypothetical protein